MANTIITKNSSTASAVPTSGNLVQGELAVNVTDKRLFTEDSGGTVVEVGTNPSSLTLPNGTANGVTFLNGSKALTSGSALTFDGTNLGVGATPSYAVDIRNAASTALRVGSNGNAFGSLLSWDNPSGTGRLWTLGAYDFVFGVNSTEQMRLTSTGLGIGTSSPNYSLTSYKVGANANYLQVANGSTGAGSANGLLVGLDASGNGVINAQGSVNLNITVAGVQRATIDSSGNLGLGVTPSAGGSIYYKSFELGKAGCGLFAATASLTGSELTYLAGNAVLTYSAGPLWSYGNNGNAASYGIEDGNHKWYTAPSGTAGSAISFAESARITSSGDLLVGTTLDYGRLTVYSNSGGWTTNIRSDDTGTQGFVRLLYGSTAIGSITGNNTTTTYATSSDYRLKNTIAPMTGALAKVAALKPCTYKWNADGSDGEGFIAHELAQVCPQAVSGEKDAVDADGNPVYQGIDTSFLVATLTAAIQEQQAIIEQLKADVAALKGN